MSTIPKGLRADRMRAHMEDKGLISQTGSLYMGGTVPITLYTTNTTTTSCYQTVELVPGSSGYVLCSQGSGQVLKYQELKEGSFAANIITKDKIGAGGIVSPNNDQYRLSVETIDNDISITFTPIISQEE